MLIHHDFSMIFELAVIISFLQCKLYESNHNLNEFKYTLDMKFNEHLNMCPLTSETLPATCSPLYLMSYTEKVHH